MSRCSKIVMVEHDLSERTLPIFAFTRRHIVTGEQTTRIYLPWQDRRVRQILALLKTKMIPSEETSPLP